MHLEKEIAEQPVVLERLLSDGAAATAAAAATIRDFNPAFACIAARGTSDNAAIYAQYLWGHAWRLPVMLATPSLHTIYRRPPNLARALVIGISQSGQAEDVRAVLRDANQQGALSLAITNFEGSPLAQEATLHLPLLAERELSVAATKTYTAQLTVIAMLASALAADQTMREDMTALPALARETLSLSERIADWASRYRDSDHLVTLGRGFNYATAREISLKVKELTYTASEGYSAADFLHGPIAAIDAGHAVILVAPSGETHQGMRAMWASLAERGAETLVISDRDELLERGTQGMPIAKAPAWLSPVISVMPGQIYALRQALVRGYQVDAPRGLSKVTITK